jgi:hypothetical protein
MDDIKALAKQSKTQILEDENKALRERVMELESSLLHSAIRPEELICIEQIELLKQKSTGRELTLDEVRRLDILIKNLRLIQGQSTEATEHKDYRNVKEADLVAIARTKEDDQ